MGRRLAVVSTDLGILRDGFLLATEAEGKSPATIANGGYSVRDFLAYADAQGWPGRAEGITRQQITLWPAHLQREAKGSTPATKYRGLLRFFGWVVSEGELTASPMVGMKPPATPETLAPVPSTDQRRRLLKATEGRAFEDRRDAAIITLFIDTGARLSEVALLAVGDVSLQDRSVTVMGKGHRPRILPVGARRLWR